MCEKHSVTLATTVALAGQVLGFIKTGNGYSQEYDSAKIQKH